MESLKTKYNKNPRTADIYSLSQLKIALDDVLVEYAQTLGHKESHTMTDIQNTVGIISIGLTLAVISMSYFCKSDEVRPAMAICIYIYFALNIICFLISSLRGGKIVFEKFEIATAADQTPAYKVLINSKGKSVSKKYNKCVFDLFDDTGKMDHNLFLKDMEDLFKD